jgi:copper chaperone CopZ
MERIELTVRGMSCGGCVASVRRALEREEGVEVEGVSVGAARVAYDGMTCAACSSRVQRALERTDGVRDASVNLMTRNAAIAYDPRSVTPERLVEVIRDTGYDAELAEAGQTAFEEQEEQDRAQEEEFRELRLKAGVSLALAAVGMVISMPVMSAPHTRPRTGWVEITSWLPEILS